MNPLRSKRYFSVGVIIFAAAEDRFLLEVRERAEKDLNRDWTMAGGEAIRAWAECTKAETDTTVRARELLLCIP